MVDDKIKVTHDNNGRFYRIKMDLAKEGSEIWDLTPYFKGRVGDNRFGLQVVWTYQGRLLDTTGMKPYIEGNVGNYSFDDKKDLQLAPDAATVRYTGNPSDCQSGGRATYYFPEQMFPRDGIFKGYIGLLDDRDDSSQPHISGVTVWFRVLPGIAQMGHACDVYISDLDKALQNFKVKLDQHDKDYQTQLQQVIDDARNTYNNQTKLSHDASVAAQAEADKVRQDMKSLSNEIGQQQDYINSHNIVTTDKFTSLSNDLTRYVTESFVQPEAFNSLDELKRTYPSGKNGIFVAIDTGHFYVWQDNAWKDCGIFQSAGIADKSILIEKLSDTLQGSYYADVTELKIDHVNTGYMDGDQSGKIITEKEDTGIDPVHTDIISVSPGEEYYVTTQSYWNGRAVNFLKDGTFVKALPEHKDTQIKYVKITIPSNINGVVLNGTRTFPPRIFKISSYTQIPDALNSFAPMIKAQNYNFEPVTLTKRGAFGYWDKIWGGFLEKKADPSSAQVTYEPVKVKPFEVYRVSGCSKWDARLWIVVDYKGKVVDYCSTENSDNLTDTIVIPSNGAYLEINELMLNTVTKLEKAVSVQEKKILSDKKWTAIGDSWTQIHSDKNQSYVDYVGQITGVTATNAGAGGTGYVAGGANNWNNQFYKHEIPNNSDVYTIFGSFNDAYATNFKFGKKGDTGTDTLWGSMLATINHVYDANPDALIGVITPGPWGAINPFKTDKMSTLDAHDDATVNDMAINDFAEKYVSTLKDFAKMYSLPFLDLYHESNLRPWNDDFINSYYHGQSPTDTTHPNPDAMKKFIAPKIAKFIESFA